MWGLLVALLVGLLHGLAEGARVDRAALFGRALAGASVLALGLSAVAWLAGTNPMAAEGPALFAHLLSVAALAVAYLVGAWSGHLARGRRAAAGAA